MSSRAFARLAVVFAAALAVLAGCGDSSPDPAMGTIRTEPLPTTEPELPPVEPTAAEDCPYLSISEASSLGGAPVTEARIDDRVDPAACFFYGTDGDVILATTVYTVDSAERAVELVEESAPSGVAEEITLDGGWAGGGTTGPTGSIVVLSRDSQVLAVQTVDKESDAARRVAELVGPRIAG